MEEVKTKIELTEWERRQLSQALSLWIQYLSDYEPLGSDIDDRLDAIEEMIKLRGKLK